MNIAVLIPAYNPGEPLLLLVDALIRLDFRQIIVVNDGSRPSCRDIFDKLAKMRHCRVIHHAVNLGKGRALKSGFNYCLVELPDLIGIVTADADGQHTPDDILKLSTEFLSTPRSLVIGARTFTKEIPLRNLLGNIVTRHVFRMLIGGNVSDTQSGLRGVPMDIVPDLVDLEGERYEYEMNTLIAAKESRISIREVGIAAVYPAGNRSSHFNPLLDSMRIYFLLLRFSFSSLFASSIDFIIFTGVYLLNRNILTALVLARLVSGCINFLINRNRVFHDRGGLAAPLGKYLLLFTALGTLSFLSIRTMAGLGFNVIIAKILAESVLFLASFTIQRDFIFTTPALGRER